MFWDSFKDDLRGQRVGRLIDEDYENRVLGELFDIISPLIERIGHEGLEKITHLSVQVAQGNWETAVSLMEKSPDIVERLLPHGDQSLVMDVYGLAARMASNGSRIGFSLLEKSPLLIEALGYKGLEKVAYLTHELARDSWATAVSLMEQSPDLIDRVGYEGLESIAGLAGQVARSSWMSAVALLEKSPHLLDRILPYGDQSLVTHVYSLAARIAGLSPGTAVSLLEKSPHLIDRIGFEGLERVAALSGQIAQDSSKTAVTLIEKSPDIIDTLFRHGDLHLVMNVYALAAEIAGHSSGMVVSLLEKSPELIGRVGYEGLKKVAVLGSQVARDSYTTADSFIKKSPDIIERIGLEGLEKIAGLSRQVAMCSCETAACFIDRSPDLIDRVGYEGLEKLAIIGGQVARDSDTTAISLIEKSPELIDRLFRCGNQTLVMDVYALGGHLARHSSRIAVHLMEKSPDIIHGVGFEGLEKISHLAHEVAQDSWTTAVSVIEKSPELIDRIGFEGLKKLAHLALQVCHANSYGAVSLVEKSPELIDCLLRYGDQSLVMEVYDLVDNVAQYNWRTAVSLLEKSPELIERVGYDGLEKVAGLGTRVAEHNWKIAVKLLGMSPEIIDRIDYKGLEIIAGLSSEVAQNDWTMAVTFLETTPELIDRLLRYGDQSSVRNIYTLADGVAKYSWEVAVGFLEKSPDFVDWVGFQGLQMIAHHVGKLAETDLENALSFVKCESIDFTRFIDTIPKGLELKDIRPVLSMYLNALLGYGVEIEEAENVSTDGEKIYLPKKVQEFQNEEENFLFYKVISTHQEAHLEYGSFDFDMEEVRDVITRIESRYGKKGRDRMSSDLENFYQLFPEPELAEDLMNILEDYRIETRLKMEYPVLREQITRMNLHMLSKRPSLESLTNLKQRSVEVIGQTLMAGKGYDNSSSTPDPILKYALSVSGSLQSPESNIHDTARRATDLYFLIDETFKESYRPVKPISEPIDQSQINRNIGNFGRTSKNICEKIRGENHQKNRQSLSNSERKSGSSGETNPSDHQPDQDEIQQSDHRSLENHRSFESNDTGGKYGTDVKKTMRKDFHSTNDSMKYSSVDKIERLLRELFKEKGIKPKEVEQKIDSMKPREVGVYLTHLESLIGKKTELEEEKGTYLYPEWGEDINNYRANWSRIREQNLEGIPLSFYQETIEKHSGLLKKIRREFQMLRPEGLTKLKRQYDGDEIDLDAAVEYFIDRKIGLSPSEKNYILTKKRERDIAVVFLIDMSRSTKGPTIQCEKESLIIMSEALSEVGDAFGIYGFSGDNRDNVDFYRIKGFEESYNQKVKTRISAIEDGCENRDGTAIRHTVNLLRKRDEKTKMIILLSDGKPVDKEYSGTYAIEDTRMALKEAQRYGIKTFCITVDGTAAEYLPRMYSNSSWVVIDDVVKLPEKITRIYRMLTE